MLRRNVFPMRTVGQQSRLSGEIALSLSLEAFKTHLDTALSNLSDLRAAPAVSKSLD